MLSVYTVAVVAIGLHITHRERNVKLLLPVANETKSLSIMQTCHGYGGAWTSDSLE